MAGRGRTESNDMHEYKERGTVPMEKQSLREALYKLQSKIAGGGRADSNEFKELSAALEDDQTMSVALRILGEITAEKKAKKSAENSPTIRPPLKKIKPDEKAKPHTRETLDWDSRSSTSTESYSMYSQPSIPIPPVMMDFTEEPEALLPGENDQPFQPVKNPAKANRTYPSKPISTKNKLNV